MTPITLTPQQQSIKDALMDFLFSDEQVIILQGHAGTGKTTLINQVLDEYTAVSELTCIIDPKHTPIKHFYLTAMTHKAKHALKNTTTREVFTLHGLLRLRPKLDTTLYTNRFSHIASNSLIVVDECSYIDYDTLVYLKGRLGVDNRIKFIFMGDKYQLTPVGLNHSPIFNLGCRELTLTHTVRQQNAPLIAQACQMFREIIAGTASFSPIKTDDRQIIHLAKKDFEKAFLQSFSQQKNAKIIRHTNHQVRQSAAKVFKHLTGRKEWKVGDIGVCNSFYQQTSYPQLRIYADTQLVVNEVSGLWLPTVGAGCAVTLTLSDLDSPQSFKVPVLLDPKYATQIADANGFMDFRPSYACTVHKSQGSTYDEVFINLNDFKTIYQKDEKATARLLYVAFSRARQTIYLTGDIA